MNRVTVTFLWLCATLTLPAAERRTFVVVHGAFQDASGWQRVATALKSKGSEVIVVNLPGRPGNPAPPEQMTAVKYRDAIVEAIGNRRNVTLIGHSFGGIQISNVAEAIPGQLHALVYVAAYLPKNGESLQSISTADKESLVAQNFVPSSDYKTASIKDQAKVEAFCGDCSAKTKATFASTIIVEPLPPMAQPVALTPEKFGAVKKYYIMTLRDKAISPGLQKSMYEATRVEKIFTLDTGHAPFISQPKALAKILLSIP